MNTLLARKKIANQLDTNPKAALNLASKLVIAEPEASVNYKNLAYCYSRNQDVDRALATLELGRTKTNETFVFWESAKASIFIEHELFRELTESLIQTTLQKNVNDLSKKLLWQNFGQFTDVAILSTYLNRLEEHLDPENELWADFCYHFYSKKKFDCVNRILRFFRNEGSLSYVNKKKLSIVFNNGNLTSRGEQLLTRMVEEAPTIEATQEDLLELSKVKAFQGNVYQALECLDRLLKINPNSREALRSKIFYLHYSELASIGDIQQASRRFYELMPQRKTAPPVKNNCSDVLKIGFISSCFNMHPVGWMTAGFFCEVAKLKHLAQIHIISRRGKPDFVAKTIENSGNIFHDYERLSDEDLERNITLLGLDILVDLEGLGLHSEIDLLIHKPSTFLVKWVGGLMGSTYFPEYDFLISDKHQTPKKFENDFSEAIIYMDENYVTYTPPPYKLRRHEAPHNLNDFITFGCFNNVMKISDSCVNAWAQILDQVDQSILYIKDRSTGDTAVQKNLREKFSLLDIDPARIQFWPPTKHEDHLKYIQLVDIALDPFPYTGGLSTLEAVFMGVPVIALSGRLLCHRHSTTHLAAIGHPELISIDQQEYVETAVALANDKDQINNYRSNLPRDLEESPLLNHKEFAEGFIKKMAALNIQRSH